MPPSYTDPASPRSATTLLPVSHNRNDSTGTASDRHSPSCAPATCIPSIPGSTGENETSREGDSGNDDVTSGLGDFEGDTDSDGETDGSGAASSDEQADSTSPEARATTTNTRD